MFNGTKEWILIDPKQTDLVYMSEDSQNEWGGFSVVNVDAVDLEIFPKIRDVHYSKITLNKGDCLFVPGGMYNSTIICYLDLQIKMASKFQISQFHNHAQ